MVMPKLRVDGGKEKVRNSIGLFIVGVLALGLAGCTGVTITGSGHSITEARNVNNFNAVSLAGFGDVTITQGATEALTVEAEDNIMPLIKTEVRDGTLILGFDRDNWSRSIIPTRAIKFNLSVKNLNAIAMLGAGSIQASDLKSDRLTVTVSGAGNVKLDHIDAAEVAVMISGAGNVDLAGQATTQSAMLSGLGSYRAGDLVSQTARVQINGVGGATLWARENLDATINGTGSINYYGSPQIAKSINGLGAVTSLGNK